MALTSLIPIIISMCKGKFTAVKAKWNQKSHKIHWFNPVMFILFIHSTWTDSDSAPHTCSGTHSFSVQLCPGHQCGCGKQIERERERNALAPVGIHSHGEMWLHSCLPCGYFVLTQPRGLVGHISEDSVAKWYNHRVALTFLIFNLSSN